MSKWSLPVPRHRLHADAAAQVPVQVDHEVVGLLGVHVQSRALSHDRVAGVLGRPLPVRVHEHRELIPAVPHARLRPLVVQAQAVAFFQRPLHQVNKHAGRICPAVAVFEVKARVLAVVYLDRHLHVLAAGSCVHVSLAAGFVCLRRAERQRNGESHSPARLDRDLPPPCT